ncbi:hypothetical protein [Plasmodium yoelii yoelii]|uniref:Uncharacterized protein n=1 Tax=Plasmodium yoelii yoelii TaxID=73239 RepID=Q7R7J1_PLAYO|nr:hypothetical protein [Plasmodium yoelii yoelii]
MHVISIENRQYNIIYKICFIHLTFLVIHKNMHINKKLNYRCIYTILLIFNCI